MAAAFAGGLICQKRQAREQHWDQQSASRRRRSPSKNRGLCNGNLVDIFSKVRVFGLKKRRLLRQGLWGSRSGGAPGVTLSPHGLSFPRLLLSLSFPVHPRPGLPSQHPGRAPVATEKRSRRSWQVGC
ncbi:hypothetical protein P7K49_000519 [Saguinus oedipus]|uniref:Uncharacterized protein n=1 Tax=Saguinus oedipus TaxID=9490 RepID=A0ABQ9WBW8_SAGOE|nr:hypothetical protein P7K49_000519 [Saguinus oedipus]